MQDILRYSPLEAGIRFLPSTLMIVTVAPLAGRLSDGFGPRWLIVGGLAIVAASLCSFSGIAVTGAIFQGAVGGNFESAAPEELVDALGVAMLVSALVAASGAIFAAVAIRAKHGRTPASPPPVLMGRKYAYM